MLQRKPSSHNTVISENAPYYNAIMSEFKAKGYSKTEAEEFSAELVFHLLFVFPASFKFEPHVFINKSEKNMLENFKEDFLPS